VGRLVSARIDGIISARSRSAATGCESDAEFQGRLFQLDEHAMHGYVARNSGAAAGRRGQCVYNSTAFVS
jgi:hypothetical protein